MRIRLTISRVIEFNGPESDKNLEIEGEVVGRELALAEQDPAGYRTGEGFWVANGERIRD